MATDYPGAVDSSSKLPNPAAGNNTNNPGHAALHDNVNDAIKASQTKLGTGSSTAAANQLLVGTGAGTSAWQGLTSAQLLAILSDETGTGLAVFATTPTLITPKVDTINENTPGNGTTVGGVNLKSGAIVAAGAISGATTIAGSGAATLGSVVTNTIGANGANHIALSAGASKLVKSTVLRQDDTTNTYQVGNSVMLTGWGVGVPGASATFQETVTFGVTFTQRPIVIATFGGDNASGTATYGAGGAQRQNTYAEAHTITTTNFLIRLVAVAAWTAGDTAFYQWTAIGEI